MFWISEHIIVMSAFDVVQLLCSHWKEWTYSDFSVTIDAKCDKSALRKIFQKILYRLEKTAILVPIYYGGKYIARGDEYGKEQPL